MAEEKSKSTKVAKKGGSKTVKFLKETVVELKKVIWPTKKQLAVNTAIVIGASILMALLITGFDSALVQVEKILGLL